MELGFLPEYKSPPALGDSLHPRKLEDLVNYPPRPYSSLEVEISTRCNLSCPSCPRTTFKRTWLDQDMSLGHFEQLSAHFNQFETIFFRGWGEPLLNPLFPEMARLAYQSGARLALATNGVLPLDQGLWPYFDTIIYRLECGRARTYERRNPAAQFGRVIFNISQVLHQRDSQSAHRPQIVIIFAKNRYTLNELPIYMDTAIRLRPDRVIFYQPCFHPRAADWRGELPGEVDPGLLLKIDERLKAMAADAQVELINQKVDFDRPKGHHCVMGERRSLFLNWKGQAALCRFGALPVAGGTYSHYQDGRLTQSRVVFLGSLLQNGLDEIAKSWAMRELRASCRQGGLLFKTRQNTLKKHTCYKFKGSKGQVLSLGDARIKSGVYSGR
ncbi:MAG: radical SAM/SPASM domain-containing protein [Pseudomonadota bacterium]